MTKEAQDILEDFYSGNTKYVTVSVVDAAQAPKNLSGAEIAYTIYTDKHVVVVRKSSLDGEITVGGAGNSEATVTIAPTDTLSLSGLYRHEMTITDSNNVTETVMRGKVQIYRSYATRFRDTNKHAYLLGG